MSSPFHHTLPIKEFYYFFFFSFFSVVVGISRMNNRIACYSDLSMETIFQVFSTADTINAMRLRHRSGAHGTHGLCPVRSVSVMWGPCCRICNVLWSIEGGEALIKALRRSTLQDLRSYWSPIARHSLISYAACNNVRLIFNDGFFVC